MPLVCTFDRKLDLTGHECKQGVVFAHADVLACMKLGAALTNNDAARIDCLAAVNFHAQSFRFLIAAIPSGAAAFFVCHLVLLMTG